MLHEHGRRDVTSVLAGVPDVPRALEDREKGVGGHVQEGERERGVGTAVPSRGHVIILGDNIGYVCAQGGVCVCVCGVGCRFACGRARAEDRTYRRSPPQSRGLLTSFLPRWVGGPLLTLHAYDSVCGLQVHAGGRANTVWPRLC
jgi:hypothetical protein